jgi:hypothetical protein
MEIGIARKIVIKPSILKCNKIMFSGFEVTDGLTHTQRSSNDFLAWLPNLLM